MLGNAKSQIRVRQLNSGSGELRPEMFKVLNHRVLWLTGVSSGLVYWEGNKRLANWSDLIPMHKMRDNSECTN